MKLGFLCSAGGAPVFSSLNILFKLNYIDKTNIKILTDRDCDALYTARKKGIETKKIEWTDKKDFSKKSHQYFLDCNAVVLLYSRLISEELYSKIATINIHPSFLPAFQGQNPLKRAYQFKSRFLGCSLHMVDHTVDNGNLIAQVVRPLPLNASFDKIKKISYLEKTYLILLLIEMIKEETIRFNVQNNSVYFMNTTNFNNYANPAIKNLYISKEYNYLYKTEMNKLEI